MSSPRSRGFQLVEVLVVGVVASTMLAVIVPNLLRWTRALRVELAAQEIVGALRQARARAIRMSVRVGVKFRTAANGRVTYALYADGDGDGVLTRDIESGVDPQVTPPHSLTYLGARVGFGFPPGPPPRDPGNPSRPLDRLHDPIRFNRSDLASFNPLGGSTSGSLYLTDGIEHLWVVRLLGRTGKVKAMRYDFEERRWRE